MAKGLSHGRPAGKCQDPGFEPRCPESSSHLPPYAVILSRSPPPTPRPSLPALLGVTAGGRNDRPGDVHWCPQPHTSWLEQTVSFLGSSTEAVGPRMACPRGYLLYTEPGGNGARLSACLPPRPSFPHQFLCQPGQV